VFITYDSWLIVGKQQIPSIWQPPHFGLSYAPPVTIHTSQNYSTQHVRCQSCHNQHCTNYTTCHVPLLSQSTLHNTTQHVRFPSCHNQHYTTVQCLVSFLSQPILPCGCQVMAKTQNQLELKTRTWYDCTPSNKNICCNQLPLGLLVLAKIITCVKSSVNK